MTGTGVARSNVAHLESQSKRFPPLMGDPTNPQDTLFLFVFFPCQVSGLTELPRVINFPLDTLGNETFVPRVEGDKEAGLSLWLSLAPSGAWSTFLRHPGTGVAGLGRPMDSSSQPRSCQETTAEAE